MARADKVATVAELTESFRQAAAAVLTEYRGLTVAELKELRRSLAADARYAIVKNTLTKLAVREAGVAELEPLLEGPSAVAFVTGDPIVVAKGIRDFARTHPALVVKGGLFDGKPMTADELRRLADLESREVLLAKLAGAMKASLSQAVGLFAAPLSQAARAIAGLEAKAQADPTVLAAGPGTPAPEPQPTSETTAESEPAADSAAHTPGPAELPSDGTPGVEPTPDTTTTSDPGEQAQVVADATDAAPGESPAETSTEPTS